MVRFRSYASRLDEQRADPFLGRPRIHGPSNPCHRGHGRVVRRDVVTVRLVKRIVVTFVDCGGYRYLGLQTPDQPVRRLEQVHDGPLDLLIGT